MEGSIVKSLILESEKKIKKSLGNEDLKPVVSGKDGKYYLVRLEMERENLKALSDNAEKDARLLQLTEDVSGKIRNAVGKAHLLTTKRFKQFAELCHDNIEQDPEKKETKPSDLQGYWEMMSIQIDDVKALFKDIETLKENGWIMPTPAETVDTGLKTNSSTKVNRISPNKTQKTKGIDDEKVKREARNRFAAAKKQARLKQQQEELQSNNSLNTSMELLKDNLNSVHIEETSTVLPEKLTTFNPDHSAPFNCEQILLPDGEEQLPIYKNGINSGDIIISNIVVQGECTS
ncbi:disks large-associated protein 1 isoform X2 [Hydra vulgaris]|uniref:Disks large-associated protein 1 isoform X2 n=1 Tax=Hydra vulgaris TaxID=6087 RepID=A0ABM4CYR4_HYDVU